jgi:uncharacterized membrane protein YfcA
MTPQEVYLTLGILLAGFFLGLLGGGGGILLVPLLLFLGGLSAEDAAFQSLTLLGAGAAVGVVLYSFRSKVDFLRGSAFALASFATLTLWKSWLLPLFPATAARDEVIFFLFLLVMFSSGVLMIRKKRVAASPRKNLSRAAVGGIAAGTIMGLTGAGGGFVIVPGLVEGLGLPMHLAVGTSLWVIALTSAGNLLLGSSSANWPKLQWVVALLAGVIPGFLISPRISSDRLKKGFGFFTLWVAVGSLILKLKGGTL